MSDKTQTFEHPLAEAADSSSKTGWIVSALLLLTVVGVVAWLLMNE